MIPFAIGFCLVIAAFGVLGVVSPRRLMMLVRKLRTRTGLYFAAAFRLVFGALLLRLASDSAAPGFLQVFGGLAVVAGVATPLLGPERAARMVDWWAARPGWVLRLWALSAIGLGLFLVWALLGWVLVD